MNGDSIDSSRSPSPGSHRGPAKRQRLETSASSSFNASSNDSGPRSDRESTQLRELAVLRKRLSHTEAAAVQHRKIRNQIEELCEKEKNILEMQVQMDRETIEQLQHDLEIATRATHEAREAQAAAEAKITALLIENAKLKGGTKHSKSRRTSKHPKNDEETKEDSSSDEEAPIDFEGTNNENLISQDESNPQDIEVKDVRIVVQRFRPEIPSTEGQETSHTKAKRGHKSQKVASPLDETASPKRSQKKRTSALKRKSAVLRKVEEPIDEQEEKADKILPKPSRSRSRTSSGVQPEAIFTPEAEELESQADVPQNESDTFQRRSQRVKKVARGTPKTESKEPEAGQDDIVDPSDHEDAASEVSKEYDPYPDSSYVNDPLALISDDNDEKDNKGSASEASDNEESSPHLNHDEDFVSGDNNSHLDTAEVKEQESSIDKQPNDLRIRVGRHCFVLASDPKFHDIDWNEEYALGKSSGFECRKCSMIIKTKRLRMEDHVWTVHYGGKFTCPECGSQSPLFASRESILHHNERKHPHLLLAKDDPFAEVTG